MINPITVGLGALVGGLVVIIYLNQSEESARTQELARRLAWDLELKEQQVHGLRSQLEQLMDSQEEPWMRDMLPEPLAQGVVYMNTEAVEYGDHQQAVRKIADALTEGDYVPHSYYMESRGRAAVHPLPLDDDDVWYQLLTDFYAVTWSISHATAERMVDETFRRGVGLSLRQAEDWWKICNSKLLTSTSPA